MLARLLAVAAPPSCLACREPPAQPGALLCPACAGALPWLARTCARCALPGCGAPRAGPCPARGAAFAAAWAPWALAGPARSLVHALKFRGALRVADALAAAMAAGAPAWVPRGPASPAWVARGPAPPAWVARGPAPPARAPRGPASPAAAGPRRADAASVLAPADHVRACRRGRGDAAARLDLAGAALVPVPADPLRARRRGLDHTALLAAALAVRLDLPVAACLTRRAGGGRQVGSGRGARRAAVTAAVRARAAPPAVAVLVDDVHTTGATLDACARVLRVAGARQVLAVTATRAL